MHLPLKNMLLFDFDVWTEEVTEAALLFLLFENYLSRVRHQETETSAAVELTSDQRRKDQE